MHSIIWLREPLRVHSVLFNFLGISHSTSKYRGFSELTPSVIFHRAFTTVIIILGIVFVALTVAQIQIGFGQGFPRNQHHMPDQKLFLFLHFGASLMLFLLIPLQVFKSVRSRLWSAHRYIGMAILIFLVPAAVGGISLASTIQLDTLGKLGFGLGGAFWLISAYVAYYHALQGNRRLHQAWAEIFAAVTLGAIAIRLEYPLYRELGIDKDTSYTFAVWSAWFGSLAIVLLWQWQRRLWTNRKAGHAFNRPSFSIEIFSLSVPVCNEFTPLGRELLR